MVVNYVDVALALIIVAYIISGWKRGFFITVLNFVRYAFGFALCFYISDNSAQAVYDDYVKERALERINEKIVTSDKAPQLLENLQQAVNALPKDIAGSLDISSVNLSSKNVSQEILDNLFKPILMFLTQAALFVAVFIVFFGATAVIMYYVKRAKKRRRKKAVNRQLCGATHKRREQNRHFTVALGRQRAARHHARNGAAEADEHRHHTAAGKSDFAQ